MKLSAIGENLDSQTLMLYTVEELIPKGRSLPKLSDVNGMLTDVFDDRWFRSQLRCVKGFQVHDGRGRRGWAYGWRDDMGVCHIAVPASARYELIVLHELSHGLEPCAGHDGDYVSTYLQLVRYMGDDIWRQLRNGCIDWGVRHRRTPQRTGHDYGPWADILGPPSFFS